MEYAYIFIAGVVIAFVVSIPIGAVNMAIFQTTIYHNRMAGYSIGVGAIIAELVYCAIPLFSLNVLLEDTGIIDVMFIIFIPLLALLGVVNIVRRNKGVQKDLDEPPRTRRSNLSYIVYGFFLCLSNPMTLFFWVNATVMLRAEKVISQQLGEIFAFALGVPLGTFLLYMIFVVLADKTRSRLNPRLHSRINVIIGVIFLALSVYLLISYLSKVD